MKLFVSYARVDKPYCRQIVEHLSVSHEVWYDQRLHVGQEWWAEIKRRLVWCGGFVYLLSPESVKSEYCQEEYNIANSTARHIFPVLIRANTDIPDKISAIHYADLSEGLENVKDLLGGIAEAERRGPQPQEIQLPFINSGGVLYAPITSTSVGTAADAMDAGDYDYAVFILKRAQQTINDPDVLVIIAKMLETAEQGLERKAYLREASRKYAPILELVRRESTRELGCAEFADFQREFPGHDPEQLDQLCRDFDPGGDDALADDPKNMTIWEVFGVPRSDDTQPIAADKDLDDFVPTDFSDFLPPPFEWCEIPAGKVTLEAGGYLEQPTTFVVGRFWIAKYPITNVQYQVFLEAEDGYGNAAWWDYSEHVMQWWQENREPVATGFAGDDLPRTNVSWYEAIVFGQWLTARLGPRKDKLEIRLPTEQEWQRAAQGDDGREYPWGNMFDKARANTAESGIRQVTAITHYPAGASPFSVLDMSGNVGEWCLTRWEDGSNDLSGKESRLIRGGTWDDFHALARTTHRFINNPRYGYFGSGLRLVLAPAASGG